MIDITQHIKEERETRRKHLDLSEPCCERGGNSTNHKGVLSQFLNTTIPSGRILLCHACNNGKCSNPKHLYWGTDKDNLIDSKLFGTWQSPWQRMIEKYGYDVACQMNRKNSIGNSGGSKNKGKKKTQEHRNKISESLKKKSGSGEIGETQST
jgi:hypothetical protein